MARQPGRAVAAKGAALMARVTGRSRRVRALECLRVVHDVFASVEVATLAGAHCRPRAPSALTAGAGGRLPAVHDLHPVAPLPPGGGKTWPYAFARFGRSAAGRRGPGLSATLCSADALLVAVGNDPQLGLGGWS